MTDSAAAPPVPPRRVLAGGFKVFLAESLLIPSGLLTAAYLARRLGPEGYGLFTVAAAVVAWVEWSLTGGFSRASVKFVAEAREWRAIGSTIVSAHVALGAVGALLLAAFAGPISTLLDTPSLATPLRLFALDIPLFCLAQAHRHVLVGIGDFGERALAAAARWVSRLVLVVLLVELGLSISGAILGSIGASLIEVLVCRRFVRPGFSTRAALEFRRLWGTVAPLLVSALALRLYDRLDLFAVTALGGSAESAGHYGAAQNLALLPGLAGLSFIPLLLTTLTRAVRDSDDALARRMGRDALRGVLLLLPFAALCAGAEREIVALVFGPAFAPAAPLVAPLLFAAVALVLVSVCTAMLTAAGRPGLVAACTIPIPVVAGLAYLAIVPRVGPRGAAFVTLAASSLAALALVGVVARVCRVVPPAATAAKSALVSAGVYASMRAVVVPGPLVLLEMAAIAAGIVLLYRLTGELTLVLSAPAEPG